MLKDCEHEEWFGICLTCTPDTWQHHAACIDAPKDTCFPPEDEPHLYAVAKRLCETCPVIGLCLEIGLDDKHGMWGGLDPTERYALVRSKKVPKDRLERRKFLRVYAYTN